MTVVWKFKPVSRWNLELHSSEMNATTLLITIQTDMVPLSLYTQWLEITTNKLMLVN